MVREMLSKIRQRSWEVGQSLAGDGMLLRLRNASIALVGAVAAVGLGLTLFISQLGFPAVFSGPIPGNPTKAGSVHDAIALTQGTALAPSSPLPGSRSRTSASGHPRHTGRSGSGGHSGGPDQIAVSPGTQRSPAEQSPAASVPAPVPATPTVESSPPAPSPAPVTAVVESQPKSGTDNQSTGVPGGGSKPSAPSTAKVTSDGSSKSKGPQTSKSDGQTVSTAKSTSPAEKAGKDQGAAASPGPAAPPAPAPAGGSSPAAAKEAADSGK
jgi:hypothetical protein